ncbi:hypothetical protein DWX58_09075 [Pseudoflavonifractor sp. AF19-9AC]|uniref:hypothetical protein n=1 Tax=Pseudoflavonifractor sp. AF19-9AC TaxID=2292244 RepID=UPI000E48BCC9|nr:hypothetical protein [Pseudoflavonifractor sp. AF19-9AC]RHR09051.1 hypothetical protein DWX58_09075 [Pseudoflavonifractor sp. AF19-9AC]
MSVDVTCALCAAGSVILLAWMDAALIAPRDKRLLCLGLVSAVPVGLLAGGNLLLKPFDLAWRNLPGGLMAAAGILCLVAVVIGAAARVVTCPMERRSLGARAAVRITVLAGAAIFLYYFLVLAPWAACFTYAGQERMITYKGQTLLEVDNSFLDPMYDYYTYHGPVFRGAELLYSSQEHRLDENP